MVIYNINVPVILFRFRSSAMFAIVLNANSVAFYLTHANVRFLPPHPRPAIVVANKRQQGYDKWKAAGNEFILPET